MSDHAVEVAVLGPVVVRGAAAPFRRSAALDLIAYLAFHRHGVSHDEWALAIWPERAVARSTVHATASDARCGLGRAPGGPAHLPRGSRLCLRQSVRTDVDRFAELTETDDPWRIQHALCLVRGPLFAGLRRADWAVFDGTRSGIESSVVDAALRGAATLVARGRSDVAEWMVRRALVVSPYDERLYRSLLRATAAQGNRARLPLTMAQLLAIAEEGSVRLGPSPDARRESARLGCLHPLTAALYRDLLRDDAAATGKFPARL